VRQTFGIQSLMRDVGRQPKWGIRLHLASAWRSAAFARPRGAPVHTCSSINQVSGLAADGWGTVSSL
jgi:hypothetical protein